MTDSELINDFIRVEKTLAEIRILVREISWDGPHTPISRWKNGASLSPTVSEADIQDALAGMLDDPSYFRRCTECGNRNPIGWMHDECICQGCAERNHGVVY